MPGLANLARIARARAPDRLFTYGRSALVAAATSALAGAQSEDMLAEAREAIPRLAGVAALPYTDVVPTAQPGVYRLVLEREAVAAHAFQASEGAGKPWQVSIRVTDPGLLRLHPAMHEMAAAVLGAFAPSEVILVVSGAKTSAAVESFPDEIEGSLTGFAGLSGKVDLAQGVTLFAVSLDSDGLLGRVQALLGSRGPVRVGAQVDEGTLASTLRAAGYASSSVASFPQSLPQPTALMVSVLLPQGTPPPFAVVGDRELIHLVNTTTELRAGFSTVKKPDGMVSDTYTLTGAQRVKLWLLGREFAGENVLAGTLKDGKLTLERKGSVRIGWTDAFGLEGVGIESVSLDAKLGDIPVKAAAEPTTRERSDARADLQPFDPTWKPEDGAKATASAPSPPKVSVGLGALLGLGEERTVSCRLGVGLANDKPDELSLALDFGSDGVGLRDLPGFRELGGEDRFVLNDVTIGFARATRSAFLGGKATWVDRGLSGRCAALRSKDGKGKGVSLLLVQCEELSLDELVPSLPDGAGVSLGTGLLALSSESLGGITGAALGGPASDMVKRVTGDLTRPVTFGQGITLMIKLDPLGLPGHARDTLVNLGVTEPVILAGGLGGLRSKAPHIELYADLPRLPIPEAKLDWLNLEPRKKRGGLQDVGARVFLQAGMLEGFAQLRLGLEGLVGVRIGTSEIDLVGQIFLQVASFGTSVRIGGRMDGEWNEPLGLAGCAFRDLVVGGSYDASQAFDVALAGGIRIGRLDYEMAGILGLQIAPTVVVPKKLGIRFEASELSQITHLQLMAGLMKGAVAGPLASAIPPGDMRDLLKRVEHVDLVRSIEKVIPLPLLKFQDVKVYLATPGASFPGLDMEGLGVGVRGRMVFLNHELGYVDSFVTLTKGLQILGDPGDVDLGLLRLTNTRVELRAPIPGIPILQEERAGFLLTGKAGAGCSFLDGSIAIEVNRDVARFTHEVELAGYRTAMEAEADLAKWPSCLVKGRFGDDQRLDTLEAVREAIRAKTQAELDKAKRVVAATKERVAAERAELQKEREAAKKRRRDKANEAIDDVKQFCQQKSKQADTPIGEKAWNAAADLAGQMRLEADGSISGVNALRSKLDQLRSDREKLGDKVGAQARQQVTAAKGTIDDALAAGKATVQSVEDELDVTAARKRLEQVESALRDFRQTLMREHVDPVAAYATSLVDSFSIDQVGFDGGLDALCSGTLPQFNIRGSFAGRTFDLQKALQLAPRGQLAARNGANLDALVRDLLALVDREAAERFTDGMARE